MLDTLEAAQIIPTILSGSVGLTVGFDETVQAGFAGSTDNSPVTLSGDNLRTETNYFIVLESQSSLAELTLTVQQSKTIYTLHDGIPQLIRYSDFQDASKLLKFDFPGGNSTLLFNIKSKTKDFFPLLYYRTYSGREGNENVIFPPSEMVAFDTFEEDLWDKDLYLLKSSAEIVDAPEDAGLALTLLYNNRDGDRNAFGQSLGTQADAIITLSYTSTLKVAEGEEFLGEI